jgi:hypothetical protein
MWPPTMCGRARGWTMRRSTDTSAGQDEEVIRNGGILHADSIAAAAEPPVPSQKSWPPEVAATAGNQHSCIVERAAAVLEPGAVAALESVASTREATDSQ